MCDEIGVEVYEDTAPEVAETYDEPAETYEPEEIFEPELPEPELPDIPEPDIPDFELPDPELPEPELPEPPDFELPKPELPYPAVEETESDLFTEEQNIDNDLGDDFDDDDGDDGDVGREYEEEEEDHDDIGLDEDEEIQLEEQDDEKDLEDIGLDEDEEIKLEEQGDEDELEDIGLEEESLEMTDEGTDDPNGEKPDNAQPEGAPSSNKDEESGPNLFTRIVAGTAAATMPFAVGEIAMHDAQQSIPNMPGTQIEAEYEAPAHPEGSFEAQMDEQFPDLMSGKIDHITLTVTPDQVPENIDLEGSENVSVTAATDIEGVTGEAKDPEEARVEFLNNVIDAAGEWASAEEQNQKIQELNDNMIGAENMEMEEVHGDPPEDKPIDLTMTESEKPASSDEGGKSDLWKRVVAGGLAATVPFAAMEVAQFDTQQAMQDLNKTEIVQEYEAPAHPEGSVEAQIDAQLDDLLSGRSDKPLTITIPADSIPEGAKINDSENVSFTMSEEAPESRVDPEEARVEFLRNYLDAMSEWADGRIKDQEEQNRIDLQKYMDETEPDPLVGDPPEGYGDYDHRDPMDDGKKDEDQHP